MLQELSIENLAVITAARMEFAPGLNIISGETGAGKTILAQALALLLGARADSGLIRPGAGEASVEAVFSPPAGCFADLSGEHDLPDDEALAVRRRLSRDGRGRVYIGGRAAGLYLLKQLTSRLMAFSAQHEQRQLMLSSRQLEMLDSYCGSAHLDLLEEYRLLHARLGEIDRSLEQSRRDAGEREREMELLRFQLEEIEAAGLEPGEEEELEQLRLRLRHAGELRQGAWEVAALLGVGEGEGGENVTEPLAALAARMDGLADNDKAFGELKKRLQAALYELEDLASAARDYAEGIDADPERLEETEQRLDLISGLARKYGSGTRGILSYAGEAAGRLQEMERRQQDSSALVAERRRVCEGMLELAGRLSRGRRRAAGELAAAVEEHLRDMSFDESGFEIRVDTRVRSDDDEGDVGHLEGSGADSVEFYVRLNPGMPASPLRQTASGGELSRIMLAVKCAVSAYGRGQTLVFDEIDAGIGGETGAAVGAKLRDLARDSQVICITHLPQIACFAQCHFSVVKEVSPAGDETVTRVERLEGERLVDELCRMMGSDPVDSEARAHAGSLLRKATSS